MLKIKLAPENLLMIFVSIFIVLVMLASCSTPFLTFPGGELKGIEATADSWEVARDFSLLQLETRPEDPYSVYLRVVMRRDKLYIDAAQKRKWHDHIKANNRVRVQLGDYIYKAIAVEMKDAELLAQFLKGRSIYRLDLISD